MKDNLEALSRRDEGRERCGHLADFRDGVCIHTDQVYDSCRERH